LPGIADCIAESPWKTSRLVFIGTYFAPERGFGSKLPHWPKISAFDMLPIQKPPHTQLRSESRPGIVRHGLTPILPVQPTVAASAVGNSINQAIQAAVGNLQCLLSPRNAKLVAALLGWCSVCRRNLTKRDDLDRKGMHNLHNCMPLVLAQVVMVMLFAVNRQHERKYRRCINEWLKGQVSRAAVPGQDLFTSRSDQDICPPSRECSGRFSSASAADGCRPYNTLVLMESVSAQPSVRRWERTYSG